MEADGDRVKLLATDLEVGLRSHCQASVTQSGIADASGKETLTKSSKHCPRPTFESRRTRAASKSRRIDSTRDMQTLPREDFPTPPDGTGTCHRDRCRRRSCQRMVAKTQFAITR